MFLDFVPLGKNKKTRFTVVRCISCGHCKTLLNNPDYCLWVDRPEAQIEEQNQPGDKTQRNKMNSLTECRVQKHILYELCLKAIFHRRTNFCRYLELKNMFSPSSGIPP